MNKIKHVPVLAVLMCLGAAPAMADPLDLNLADTPDINVSFIEANYNAGIDVLSMSGFATILDTGAETTTPIGQTFSLFANIDELGTLFPGSFFDIAGGFLTGNLVELGFYAGNNGTIEFLFEVTGGTLATLYGGIGAIGGMIITQIGYPDSWLNDWTGSFGVADVAALPAPEPGILLLASLGLALLFVTRRRKI